MRTIKHNEARRRTAGTSLVEVMVVLVVLLVGVFALIRVFPIGLTGIRQAENRTLAGRLASQLMDQLKSQDANLPQGILFAKVITSPSGAAMLDFVRGGGEAPADLDPDSLKPYSVIPANQYNPYFSDVNKFRFVVGEAAKVPMPTATAYGNGSLYTLKLGPIYMDPGYGQSNFVANSAAELAASRTFLRVYGSPLRGVNFESEAGNSYRLRAFVQSPLRYVIDYGEGASEPAQIILWRHPTKTLTYRVAFSYYNANTDSSESTAFSLTVPPSNNGQDPPDWQPLTDPATGITYSDLFEGSDTVSREFDRLPANGSWDAHDPYEFKLLSDNVDDGNNIKTYANIGLLAFNPAGANYSERTFFGQQPFVANIDYAVLDWHIIREDREVPSVLLTNGAVPMKLTLPFIKETAVTEVPGDPTAQDVGGYRGIYNSKVPGADHDLQVFDLQGSITPDPSLPRQPGDPLIRGDYSRRNGADAKADYWVDYDRRGGTFRTGTIYINPNRVPSGAQLRVLYKADGDFGVAVQKAFARYEYSRGQQGGVTNFPTSYDNFGQPGYGAAPGGNPAALRLYFDRNDLNKAIVASIEYRVNGEVQRTPPIQMTIDTVQPAPNDQFAYVDVSQYVPEIVNSEWWRVAGGTVNGVSVKVRVVWKDNASTTNVWRVQDVDSYLTRAAGM